MVNQANRLNLTWEDRLQKIRARFKDIYNADKTQDASLFHFVPHGPEHSQSIEIIINRIAPDNAGIRHHLTPKERFLLLAAAWLHDLGMMRSIAVAVKGDPAKKYSAEEIRRIHHELSEEYLVDHWASVGVEEADKDVLGELCRYHRRSEDLNKIQDDPVIEGEKVRLKLLAAYLRLADAFDTSPSRAAAEPYAVCLAMGMSAESKTHWVKNRLVQGISLDNENHTIKIQFKYPNESQLNGKDGDIIRTKIDSIQQMVTEDLREELSSVFNVIAKGGFTYYLDVEEEYFKCEFGKRMIKDLRDMVLYDDIMVNPSASKLMEITLVTVSAIAGYSLKEGEKQASLEDTQNASFADIKNNIQNFFTTLNTKVIRERKCHVGVINLIRDCAAQSTKIDSDSSLSTFINYINARYQEHHRSRNKIREKSREFVQEEMKKIFTQPRINILLYGYSELVTKAVCGLRDAIIRETKHIDPSRVRNNIDEIEVSNKIYLFICEGQPKTQTAEGDRLSYHDGSQYALHLKRRGFTNIGIIPDAIAGTIISHINIDCIFLGANGVTPKYFTHSAGHLGIVELARSQDKKPAVILVTSKEKYTKESNYESDGDKDSEKTSLGENDGNNNEKYLSEIDGTLFFNLPEQPNRNHIWMCRDSQLLQSLYNEKIYFINPREDRINIDKINYIISDVGNRQVTGKNCDTVIKDLFQPEAAATKSPPQK